MIGVESFHVRCGGLAAAVGAWAVLGAAVAWAQAEPPIARVYEDPRGDACVHRTDPGMDGALAGEAPIDLVRVEMTGWEPRSASKPFEGCAEKARKTGILRLDVTFAGLVAPPGRVDPSGWHHSPRPFGAASAYGFVEIDVDADRNTGGELGAAAVERFLAGCARFGCLPKGIRRERAALDGADLDGVFETTPQYERSGADFVFTLCGCEDPVVLAAGGNGDLVFEPGETWLLKGRYFARAGGYRDASGVFGGSDFGLYDPRVTLRVSHSTACDETTFSVVFPLTPDGAACLADEPAQPIDQIIEVAGSHFCVQEALQDLVWGASGQNGPIASSSVRTLVDRWKNKRADRYLDPAEWRAVGLFGMAYQEPEPSRFAWTDLSDSCGPIGDLDGDEAVDEEDRKEFLDLLEKIDGSPGDADGRADGVFVVPDFGPNFLLIDFNADGRVDEADLAVFGSACAADFNGVNGVTVQDIFDFLTAWLAGDAAADFNHANGVTVQDIFDFLTAWLAGC